MFAHAVMAGAAVHALALPFFSELWQAWVQWALIVGIVLKVACDMFEMFISHPTNDAQKTAHLIFNGRYAAWYWAGSFLLGSIVPFVIVWMMSVWLMPLAGLMVLAGIYISEHIWVRAPQQISLA